MKRTPFLVVIIPLVFFLIGLLTLRDYGISWDEPIHFQRGQDYLYYIFTGKKKFDEKDIKSFYQNNNLSAQYFLEKDDGHPPLNGMLAAISNTIFYQKLGILGDIESYHLFNILISTLLVLIVAIFAWQTYGVFASIIASLAVSSYPLFFAESHFNIKDPAQTAFFTLTVWAFWNSLKKGNPIWLLISVVGFSLSLGTKFNVLFLPFILLPYLLIRYNFLFKKGVPFLKESIRKIPKHYLFALILSPLIIAGIFFATWPFLWEDPIVNLLFTINWYKDIGTGSATYGYFIPGGFNLYAPIWILITTPPLVLVLSGVGIFAAIRKRKEHEWAPLLWLLWFLVPIARVVVPNTTIYGGSRQIMEFLPALALLSGLGACVIWKRATRKFNNKYSIFIVAVILLAFLPHFFVLKKLHPNENVYFNSLIGGLPGASQKNVPYWGNSLGNAYLQVVQWLNENAPQGSKLALIQGTSVNIPSIKLRDDLRFSNSFWSGIYREGEYLTELTYNDKKYYPYAWEYIEKFLEPAYEVKVDGVPIAKVWKNDLEHTKSEFKKNEVVLNNVKVRNTQDKEVVIDLGQTFRLTRLVIFYGRSDCKFLRADVSSSISGGDWRYEEEGIPTVNQLTYREKEDLPFQAYFFAARDARFLKIEETRNNSCALSSTPIFKVYALRN